MKYKVKKKWFFKILLVCFWMQVPMHTFAAAPPVDIVIDPGHGGIDSGAQVGRICEKDTVLDISMKLKSLLAEEGYGVTLTRNTDISLADMCNYGRSYERRDLNGRVRIIDNSGAKLFVSIHVNSDLEYPDANGSIVFYFGKSERSKSLAFCIQKQLNGVVYDNYERSLHNASTAKYYILRQSTAPGVLVETAFMSNPKEQDLLIEEGFREEIAKAIATGIRNYFILCKE